MKPAKEHSKSGSGYRPLAVLILVAAAAGAAVAWGMQGGWMEWMHGFMGSFLCSFAMLKLFHPERFADGFRMYDIVARRHRAYAYLYPFIELGLGLAYLAFLVPPVTYALTVIVMAVGTVGVVGALRRGLDINCPCMGSVLDVPLSTVTLTEDIAMGLMAAVMLAAWAG